jgi:hypothetical protein
LGSVIYSLPQAPSDSDSDSDSDSESDTFGSVQMKFRNIFFGFLKTWLLIAISYSGSLYAAGYMFLTLYDYQPITNNFRPYFFEKDPYTGKLTKVFDAAT